MASFSLWCFLSWNVWIERKKGHVDCYNYWLLNLWCYFGNWLSCTALGKDKFKSIQTEICQKMVQFSWWDISSTTVSNHFSFQNCKKWPEDIWNYFLVCAMFLIELGLFHNFWKQFFSWIERRKKILVTQSCLTLWPHGLYPARLLSHGISQARILKWVAISFSRGSFPPGIKPGSPEIQADSLLSEPPGKALFNQSRCFNLRP